MRQDSKTTSVVDQNLINQLAATSLDGSNVMDTSSVSPEATEPIALASALNSRLNASILRDQSGLSFSSSGASNFTMRLELPPQSATLIGSLLSPIDEARTARGSSSTSSSMMYGVDDLVRKRSQSASLATDVTTSNSEEDETIRKRSKSTKERFRITMPLNVELEGIRRRSNSRNARLEKQVSFSNQKHDGLSSSSSDEDSLQSTPRSIITTPRTAVVSPRVWTNSKVPPIFVRELSLQSLKKRQEVEDMDVDEHSLNEMQSSRSNLQSSTTPRLTPKFTPRYEPKDDDDIESHLARMTPRFDAQVAQVKSNASEESKNEAETAKEKQYQNTIDLLEKSGGLISTNERKDIKNTLIELGDYQASYYILAQLQYQDEELPQAEKSLLCYFATQKNTGNAHAQQLLGTIYYRMSVVATDPKVKSLNLYLAKNALNKSLKLDPKNLAVLHLLGEIYFDKGGKSDLVRAEECFFDVVGLDPENVSARLFLGKVYAKRQDLTSAEEALLPITEIDSTCLEAYTYLSQVYERKARDYQTQIKIGDFDPKLAEKAKSEFKKAVEILVRAKQYVSKKALVEVNLQDLRYRWDDLPIEQTYVSNNNNIWKTLLQLDIGNNLSLSRSILKTKENGLFNYYGKKVNGLSWEGSAPIHDCIKSLNLIRVLIEDYQADVNTPDEGGNTPIMQAAAEGNVQATEYLLSKGADLSRTNLEGENVFHHLIKYGKLDYSSVVLMLVKHLREQDALREIGVFDREDNLGMLSTSMTLELLTSPNKNKKTLSQLATEYNKPDLSDFFQKITVLIINVRLLSIFKGVFVPVPSKDNSQKSYVAVHNPQSVINKYLHHKQFLEKYLPCLSHAVFSSTAKLYPFNDDKQSTYFNILSKMIEINESINKRESLFSEVRIAAGLIQEVIKVITGEISFHFVDLTDEFKAGTALKQIVDTNRRMANLLNGKAEDVERVESYIVEEPFLTWVPTVAVGSFKGYMDELYNDIIKSRLTRIIDMGGLTSANTDQNKYAIELYDQASEFMTKKGLKVNERFKSYSIKRAADFIAELDKEFEKLMHTKSKKFESYNIQELARDLDSLYNAISAPKNNNGIKNIEQHLSELHVKLNVQSTRDERANLSKELREQYLQSDNLKGRSYKGIPLAKMLIATGKSSNKLIAQYLAEKELISPPREANKTIHQCITSIITNAHNHLWNKIDSDYKRSLVYENILSSIITERNARTLFSASYKTFGIVWGLISGFPLKTGKEWAAEINKMLSSNLQAERPSHASRVADIRQVSNVVIAS